jgi:ankyrin repeat protein
MLVEEAGADLAVRDRWGATPLDEARRVGAAAVVAYLDARLASGTQPGGGSSGGDGSR